MMSTSESTPTLISWLVFNPSREAQHVKAPRIRSSYTGSLVTRIRELAPYGGILILPGGSLMALLWWIYRRKKRAAFPVTR
jgi:hypothetical protein